jgi:hypothetical protein
MCRLSKKKKTELSFLLTYSYLFCICQWMCPSPWKGNRVYDLSNTCYIWIKDVLISEPLCSIIYCLHNEFLNWKILEKPLWKSHYIYSTKRHSTISLHHLFEVVAVIFHGKFHSWDRLSKETIGIELTPLDTTPARLS